MRCVADDAATRYVSPIRFWPFATVHPPIRPADSGRTKGTEWRVSRLGSYSLLGAWSKRGRTILTGVILAGSPQAKGRIDEDSLQGKIPGAPRGEGQKGRRRRGFGGSAPKRKACISSLEWRSIHRHLFYPIALSPICRGCLETVTGIDGFYGMLLLSGWRLQTVGTFPS